jgi:Amt family ammonium transporter
MNSGDTAWVLASSALVLLMTPGLAFFYGGMTRSKSVLNMMMMSTITIAVVSVIWVLYGYSLAFGHGSGNGFVGGFSDLGLEGMYDQIAVNGAPLTIPALAFVVFQMMFAIITPALVSGAIADRARFGAWIVFVLAWTTLVYFPVAHWVFDFGTADGSGGGWLARWGVVDFAGGTAVHVNAGAAGLALAFVLGKRVGWKRDPMRPHNVPFVLLGAALLWFGWFGFNAGSAGAASGDAALAFVNTQVATAAGVLGWLIVERLRDGHATTLGAASGAVAGLVAITPACAALSPIGAILLGVLAGAACAVAVTIKWRFGVDDSLDVVGVHLVGGAVGSILIGFLAVKNSYYGLDGLLYGGGASLLGKQVVAVLAVGSYSFVMAYVIGTVIDKVMGFRVTADDETAGIDLAEHAETGYDLQPAQGGPYALVPAGNAPAAAGGQVAEERTTEESVKA